MIRVESLRKDYGRIRAVDGLSFEIGRGEVVGLLGPNGAGKTTALRMLCGALLPDAGRVWIDGLPMLEDDPRPRARLGYLPEGTPLWGAMRVAELLGFAARVRGIPRARRGPALGRALERAGLAGMERRRVEELSKGYRQRVGLALALVAEPPVLVLDEPTSGLDPAEVARMRDLVRELAREHTLVVSSHVLSEVEEICGRVLILAGGRLVADGVPAELAGQELPRLRLVVGPCPDPEALRRELGLLPGVRGARLVPGSAAEVHALELDLDPGSRPAMAAAVARLVTSRGLALHELAPQRAGLERVFLSRVAAAEGNAR